MSDGDVVIEYGAIEVEGRWYPALWLRGRRDPSCTICTGYSREERQARDRRNGPILAAYDRMAAGQPVEHTPGPRHAPRGGVIELPYLDGVQHAAFPEVRHAR